MTPPKYRPELVLQQLGVELYYTTGQVAEILGRTRQAVLLNLQTGRFVDRNGQPLRPSFEDGQYFWTPEQVLDAAVSMFNFRRHRLDITGLKRVVRQLLKDGEAIHDL